MKFKNFFLIILISIFATAAIAQDQKDQNDWEKWDLKGRVKQISSYIKACDFEERVLFYKVRFNPSGYLIEENRFDNKGKITEKIKYNYNENNQIIKKVSHSTGDSIPGIKKFFYKEDSLLIKTQCFGKNGHIKQEVNFEYDSSRNLVKKIEKIDGRDLSRLVETTLTYNDKNLPIKEIERVCLFPKEGLLEKAKEDTPRGDYFKGLIKRYKNGNSLINSIYYRDYNSSGKCVSGKSVYPHKPEMSSSWSTKFDRKGNEVIEKTYDYSGKCIETIFHINEKTRSYDENGKLFKVHVFKKNNENQLLEASYENYEQNQKASAVYGYDAIGNNVFTKNCYSPLDKQKEALDFSDERSTDIIYY